MAKADDIHGSVRNTCAIKKGDNLGWGENKRIKGMRCDGMGVGMRVVVF